MEYASDTTDIFTRYDVDMEVAGQKARHISEDAQLQRIANAIVDGNEEAIEEVVRQALKSRDPTEIIDEGMVPGMREVSRLWNQGSYFLPQVILSSDAMIAGIELCEKKLGRAMEKKAKVVTHTAEGDIHDIDQVIVNALLNAAGFEVVNLGADVPVDAVIEACRVHRPVMGTGTALMTTTMTAFSKIAAKLWESDMRIPFVCGGGAVSEEFVTGFNLGIWGKEAGQAPAMAEDALKGMGWLEMRAKWNG